MVAYANRIAKEFGKQVMAQYPVKAVYLYGSHASGKANENSDIDIAVVVEEIENEEYFDIFGKLFVIAADFHANIEPNLIVDDGEYDKYSFLAEVAESGIRVL